MTAAQIFVSMCLLVALGLVAPGPGAERPAQRPAWPFTVGEPFPDLAFPSLEDGTPTRLSDFRGRKVMLHVFASW
jgi:hypothetical protein